MSLFLCIPVSLWGSFLIFLRKGGKRLERHYGEAYTGCHSSAERHDALYVVGALDEAMELRGMRYHPIDIETSVIRAHKSVTEW